MNEPIKVFYLAKQVCNGCGKSFHLKYCSDGSYEYADDACGCEEVGFSPAEGIPSITEWQDLIKEMLPLAMVGAKKLCKAGTCIAYYPCGREKNHLVKPPIPLTDNLTCPVAKYNIQPTPNEKPWYKCHVSERELSSDEFFALCACCEHASVMSSKDGKEWIITHNDLKLCCDCPVKTTLDAMQECAAKARMS